MTPDRPTEFDFDFQVDASPSESRERVADDAPSTGSGRSNGAATPGAPDDLDAPARTGNGEAQPSSSPRRRRFKANPGDGDGKGRTRRANGAGSAEPPKNGRRAKPKRRGKPRPKLIRRNGRRAAPEPPPEPPQPEEDDWLGMAQAESGGGNGMQSFPAVDGDTRSGPRVPKEGRKLAREARRKAAERRAEGRNRADDQDEVPFESLLQRQPQKNKAIRTATPLLDAVRDAAGAGAERLREGAERVRYGAANLREGGGERLRALRGQPQGVPGNGRPPRLPRIAARRPRRPKPGRIKKLRLLIIVVGLGLLAIVSTFFGMMMAISRDLPELETEKFFAVAQRSEVFDNHGRKIGTLLNNNQQILVNSEDISPSMKEATVAIEDERFYEHRGVDFQGMVRAGLADLIPGGSTQGASTITQQFVKNALEAQNSRTVFEKFREAAIAYHLERQWDKDKILTSYLNTIYFGEGAYGIEAAARTYFGYNHPGCGAEGGDPCASELRPEEAALLAGIITSPSAFSPKYFPDAAMERRNLVLQKMHDQDVLSDEEYDSAVNTALPTPSEIEKPKEDSQAPYFTSWLRQLVVDKYGPGKAFGGGLQIHSTLDLDMQQAVEDIAYSHLAGIAPTASVVVLDNQTGEIRAMVGGNDYDKEPFNIATQGQRQPGSTMKPFILATALSNGYSGSEVFSSQPKDFPIPGVNPNQEMFHVENYEGNYLGSASIATATTYSDNSVYAELGLRLGTNKIAHTAEDMGIQTKVSTNPAMVLGAVKLGFTPLEMAHAYETIAEDGERVSGNLDTIEGDSSKDPRDDGPVPINKITGPDGVIAENHTTKTRVLDAGAAETERSILETVVSTGTGTNAQGPPDAWGKTGTTENYGDAWFCGGSTNFTACVWVGYPNKIVPMTTEYAGQPVAGGTYPAEIWSSVMQAVESIYASYGSDSSGSSSDTSGSSSYSGSSSSSYSAPSSSGSSSGSSSPAPAAPAPSSGGGGGGGAPSSGGGVGL